MQEIVCRGALGRTRVGAGDARFPAGLLSAFVGLGPLFAARHEGTDVSKLPAGWLFLGQHGQLGRLLEGFHLKLRVLADAVDAVQSHVERTSRPLLGLEPDKFCVRVGQAGPGLPVLLSGPADELQMEIAPDASIAGLFV